MYRNRDHMWVLDQTRNEIEMQKISLNDIDKSGIFDNGDYQLDPTEKFVINLEDKPPFSQTV